VTLSWTSAAPTAGVATTHQLLRGPVGGLPVGSGGAEICLSAGTTAASLIDSDVPSAGAGFWYVVRAANSCGQGGYGTTSAGQNRASATCP